MKHLFMRYLLASSLLTIGMPLWAEDFRVGFINTDRIFREANTAKVAQTKLEQEFSKREKELVDLGNSLKTNSEKLERDLPTLSETQRTTKQRQLADQDREFQRKRREFQEDLNARKNEESKIHPAFPQGAIHWQRPKNTFEKTRKIRLDFARSCLYQP